MATKHLLLLRWKPTIVEMIRDTFLFPRLLLYSLQCHNDYNIEPTRYCGIRFQRYENMMTQTKKIDDDTFMSKHTHTHSQINIMRKEAHHIFEICLYGNLNYYQQLDLY